MITKNGKQIVSLEDWRLRAGPKSAVQWQDGRSAKECAKEWLRSDGKIPVGIQNLLESHPDINALENWEAVPEAEVRIDDFRGAPPNIDILLTGNDSNGPLVIIIEAKADETFGNKLESALNKAQARLEKTPNSKGVERIERLTQSIFKLSANNPQLSAIRYQLLTATGAAIAEAERRQSSRAIVLVHEFATDRTTDRKRAANANDLHQFLSLLTTEPVDNIQSVLLGPISLPGHPISSRAIKLYFGKVVTKPPQNDA